MRVNSRGVIVHFPRRFLKTRPDGVMDNSRRPTSSIKQGADERFSYKTHFRMNCTQNGRTIQAGANEKQLHLVKIQAVFSTGKCFQTVGHPV
jgi:hypothetical protein